MMVSIGGVWGLGTRWSHWLDIGAISLVVQSTGGKSPPPCRRHPHLKYIPIKAFPVDKNRYTLHDTPKSEPGST